MSPLERDEFLNTPITCEEKVDGANVGISWSSDHELQAQNRGSFISSKTNSHPQFERLWPWIYERYHLFSTFLDEDKIIFGEWCAYKHSVHYTKLPDLFLGFDVYDRSAQKFFSVRRRNVLFEKLNITPVRNLIISPTMENLISSLKTIKSAYCKDSLEGIYLRCDNKDWLIKRAKLVRPDFVQAIDNHWKNKRPIFNFLEEQAAK